MADFVTSLQHLILLILTSFPRKHVALVDFDAVVAKITGKGLTGHKVEEVKFHVNIKCLG